MQIHQLLFETGFAFFQFLLMRKPSDVIEFAADFFSSYSATTEMKPPFAHSNFVNKSAIRSE